MENSFFFSLGIWNWFILAGILGVMEVIAPGYFLIWYGLAALSVGGLALAIDISWQMQLIMYAVIGMGLLIASLRFAGSRAGESDRPMLNKRAKSYLGKTYELLDDTSNGRGSVRVGDSIWSVQIENGANLAKGKGVLITDVNGNKLVGRAS
ncbi:MAG: NfeD family protein [bacterium]|nr:NfeD family protein [bacterium]